MLQSPVKAVISDMDGVLWRGAVALPGLGEFFDLLFARELDFALATNNSRNTPADYVQKLAKMGVQGIQERHIVTSGTATIRYLRARYPAGSDIFVVGGDGLKQLIVRAGFNLVESGVAAVVCGIDFDLSYGKLRRASLLIRGGADFIGTNPDSSFPSPDGLVPGAGSILALLESATGRAPTIIGKPMRGMFDAALGALETQPQDTLMIGDRMNTDIAGAKALGMQTALVLTGVESLASLAVSDVQPDAVYAGLPELVAALAQVI
ncbi:MAG: HAD-IIA family hydrolase [Chloroflexi bacterium]|nr:HAD-IIA family hydrolase [Chloroflexota bacterium]MCY4246739.1 HAD-IIA family hydrolase [Chloroflexota bacterium]